ncbi:MAG: hypothetical protein ISP35_10375 [Ilumatobacteraceae bacterium]|nr:hypothetical protein [Ilumatobacteraceae bacterium]
MRTFGQYLIRALRWCAPAALLIALLGFAALQPDDDGEGVGIVWSRSRTSSTRSWAIDPIAAGVLASQPADGFASDIDLERC